MLLFAMQAVAKFDSAAFDAQMKLGQYLIVGTVVTGFVLGIAYIVWQMGKIPTFQQYRELHPHAKDGNGTPNCFTCNSSNIWLSAGVPFSVHVCRVCGTKLWKS